MMFSLREYLKRGFLDAVGKMSVYQIILNSAGWMEKGVLTEEDLAEINTRIEARYPAEPEACENVLEEPKSEAAEPESEEATEV